MELFQCLIWLNIRDFTLVTEPLGKGFCGEVTLHVTTKRLKIRLLRNL